MAIDSIPARLFKTAASHPAAPGYFAKSGGEWKSTSWKEYAEQVRTAARAMIALGLEAGGTVCILGFNRPEWVIFDVACMCCGGAPAGIYTTCSPTEVQYIVDHAEAQLLLLEDKEQWDKVNAERERLPKLKHVVMMKDAEAIDDPWVMTWQQFMDKGKEVAASEVEARLEALQEDQLATFIYTSGTTGPPKGVMLSHKNLAWTSKVAADVADLRSTDCSLSYLPLSHIAEQVFTIHGPITVGASVYFAESIAKVPDNLKEVQPTIFFAVPRIWEKFHAGISGKMKDATGVKAKLVSWARGVGAQVSALRTTGQEPSGLLGLQYKLAHKLIFSKLKPAVGLGRAKFCVTGAAPISQEIMEFFASLDIIVLEVYGQSEDCGPTSFNQPGRTRFGTVGPAYPGVDIKIAEDGEILVQGPNVFLGYYKDQAATDETLIDGWLYSGDLGKLSKDGFLSITGRKKEIIITAGGKNIAPKNIEAALKNAELINEAVVIGDRRKYLTALVTLDPDAAPKFAAAHGLDVATMHTAPPVLAEVQKTVDEINQLFARVEQVKKFSVLPRNLTVEDGELTPTLKVKRRIVHEHFAAEIEAMYKE